MNESNFNNKYKPSLIKAIIKAFGFKYLMYQQITIWGEILIRLSQPFLIGFLVRYSSQGYSDIANESKYCLSKDGIKCSQTSTTDMLDTKHITHSEAVLYAIMLTLTTFIFAFSRNTVVVLCTRVASNVKIAITVMIYQKIVKISKSEYEETDIGQILNILTNDLKRIENVGFQLSYLIIGPIMSMIVVYISYQYLRIACIGGLVILILFIPFQGFMGRLFNIFRSKTTKLTDERISLLGEIILAIKLVKLYCWEDAFSLNVSKIRK